MTLSTTQTRILWAVRLILALAFAAAGAAKLLGVPMMVDIFTHIGVGQWFRYLTGAVEVTGAVLLLVPPTGLLGALLLGATMVGAVFTHLAVIGGSPLPAIILGALCAFVALRLWPLQGAPLLARLGSPSTQA
jgi:putative oxidoreductase